MGALGSQGGVFQRAVVAEQGLIVVMKKPEQSIVGAPPKGCASQFVSPDLNPIPGGGPVLHRHGVALGQEGSSKHPVQGMIRSLVAGSREKLGTG